MSYRLMRMSSLTREVAATIAEADRLARDHWRNRRHSWQPRGKKGLSHREALVPSGLRGPGNTPEDPRHGGQNQEDFYGRRIVMFAPLSFQIIASNSCLYCPYHVKNREMPRKTDPGGNRGRDHSPAGYGAQAPRPSRPGKIPKIILWNISWNR